MFYLSPAWWISKLLEFFPGIWVRDYLQEQGQIKSNWSTEKVPRYCGFTSYHRIFCLLLKSPWKHGWWLLRVTWSSVHNLQAAKQVWASPLSSSGESSLLSQQVVSWPYSIRRGSLETHKFQILQTHEVCLLVETNLSPHVLEGMC